VRGFESQLGAGTAARPEWRPGGSLSLRVTGRWRRRTAAEAAAGRGRPDRAIGRPGTRVTVTVRLKAGTA
jgi:hypothetical protein